VLLERVYEAEEGSTLAGRTGTFILRPSGLRGNSHRIIRTRASGLYFSSPACSQLAGIAPGQLGADPAPGLYSP